MGGVLGLDLSPTKSGYTVGNGSRLPFTGAWRPTDHGPDLGSMLCEHEDVLSRICREHEVVQVTYEAPILRKHDSLIDLRKIYSLGAETERFCQRRGLPCIEVDLRAIKKVMTGDAYAEKIDVVNAALALGVTLPKTKAEGREDAADSFGAWVLGLREVTPAYEIEWTSRLMVGRGALI